MNCRVAPAGRRRAGVRSGGGGLGLAALGLLAVTVVLAVVMADALVASERELYKDLGVATDASKDDIKRAFRRLTREHHPDTKETFEEKETAKVAMARVLRAYEVLSDDVKRLDYDQTGFVPGEVMDPKERSAKDIFEYYHQKMPIMSKTETIDSFATVDRIKSFRGNRLSLVQVYDDACSSCRTYSSAWETLYHSGLVSAGVIKMYRIDAKSVDGPLFMRELGLSYTGSEPTVAVFVDGERWRLFGIKDAVKRQKERMMFEHLLDFVMNFFYEMHVQTTSLHATYMDAIVQFLQAPRALVATRPGAQPPLRVIFPKLNAESVPLALAMRLGDRAVVRSVDREPLMDFVQEYCRLEVNVYDRRGDLIPLPEFVVVSTETLPGGKAAAVDSNGHDNEDDADDDDEALAEQRRIASKAKCKGVELGASAALTYDKAVQFVESLLPPVHRGMAASAEDKSPPFLDALAFADVCEKNCVMWVRESCATPTEALALQELQATAKVLAPDYLSFRTGYLCLDEQPLVKAYIEKALPDVLGKRSNRGPLLLAMMDSDDYTMYAIPSLQSKAPLELTSRDVDAVLSHVVDAKEAALRKTVIPREVDLRIVSEETPFTSLLPFTPFPMSAKQRYFLLANTLFSFVSPYISNTVPFFLMWLVHTKILGRKNSGPDPNAPANGTEAAAPATNDGKTAVPPATGLPKRFPTGKRKPRPVSPDAPRPKNVVADFTKADVDEAREGKGFLLLLLDDRAMNSAALKLPLIMSDPRFTVRMLTSSTSDWNEWVRQQVGAVSEAGEANETAPAPEEEKGLHLVAIRKGRMQSAAKPEKRSIEVFLQDILDGTTAAQTPLPDFATTA